MAEHFMSFETFEEMQEFMAREEALCIRDLSDEQRAMTWGQCWVRFVAEPEPTLIFGQCMTEDEARDGCESKSEWRDLKELVEERHYMFGKAYSIIVPEGELGSTHAYNAAPITPEQFVQAGLAGWNLRLSDASMRQWLVDALLRFQPVTRLDGSEQRDTVEARHRDKGE